MRRLARRGLPALPNTLRRTCISIALPANRFDVLWVMSQVGHADSKMTMDVYAQLQQRVDREHARAFGALLRHSARAKKKALLAGPLRVARPGLEPGTPRFSVVCSTN
jgi:integrase